MISTEKTAQKSTTYFELLEACQQDECPICFLLSKGARQYLDNLLFENVNDPGVRMHLRLSLGFCPNHAEMLSSIGDAFGVAIIYKDLLERILAALDEKKFHDLQPRTECPVCVRRNEHESIYSQVIVSHVRETEFLQALRGSCGFCLNHLHQLVLGLMDGNDQQRILSLHGEKLKNLRNDLSEFIRKQDIHYRKEKITPQEESACQRGISFLVGTIG
jgi:hypothetical protein